MRFAVLLVDTGLWRAPLAAPCSCDKGMVPIMPMDTVLVMAMVELSLLVAIMCFVLSAITFFNSKRGSKQLGVCLLAAGVCICGYFASLITTDVEVGFAANVITMASGTVMMFCLAWYTCGFAHMARHSKSHAQLRVFGTLSVIDVVMIITDPATGFVGSVYYSGECVFSPFIFVPSWGYWLHMILNVLLLIGCCWALARSILISPKAYAMRYMPTLLSLLIPGILTGFYLGVHHTGLNAAVLYYGVAAPFLYVGNSRSLGEYFLHAVQKEMLDEIGQPVMLFDNGDFLCYWNENAEPLVCAFCDEDRCLEGFLDKTGMKDSFSRDESWETRSLRWGVFLDGKERSYRCVCRRLEDEQSRFIGTLFNFIDDSFETDIVTGFINKGIFYRSLFEKDGSVTLPASFAAFDYNRLTVLNSEFGRETGDKALRLLADAIRSAFPNTSTFARMDDATMVVFCDQIDSFQARRMAREVARDLSRHNLGCGPLEVAYSVSTVSAVDGDLRGALSDSLKSLKVQKMLDKNSCHSSLLDSLLQVLRENDSSSKAQGERIGHMAEQLARKLELSDSELSTLLLFCFLAEIGKVGIPQDILNKPGKLTDNEWKLVKSHVHKGYNIAMASEELEGIAPLILHHHERWDGKGYPDGLKGEAIPLASRIYSVIAAYDALTHKRPYRQPVSPDSACTELIRCSGMQFDPYIVMNFLELFGSAGNASSLECSLPAHDDREGFLLSRGSTGEKDPYGADLQDMKPVEHTRYMLDVNERIVEVDDNFTKLTGYTPEDVEALGLRQDDLIFSEDLPLYHESLAMEFKKGPTAMMEHRIRRKDGLERFVVCLGESFFDSKAKATRTEIIVSDISGTQLLNRYVSQVRTSAQHNVDYWKFGARTDGLTGIFNRRAFEDEVKTLLSNNADKLAFGIVDVDYFKQYNDKYGHPEGDKLLKTLASLLHACLPEGGFAGRLGGDEFAITVPYDPAEPSKVIDSHAHGMWEIVSRGMEANAHGVSISMGLVVCDVFGNDFDKLYKQADDALYKAKELGRNNVQVVME